MNQMRHEVIVAQPPAVVFDYVTTPGRWPEWHPSSLRLAPGADLPLSAGRKVEEDILAGGRRAQLSWVVRECRKPQSWIADAQADNGVSLSLRYDVEAHGEGHTRFIRTLDYQLPNVALKLYNALIGRRRIEAESRLSLERLRNVMAAFQAV